MSGRRGEAAGRMQAVLMVAYLYPPGGGSSGVLRPLKFSRFLPEYGWTPHVLTSKERLYHFKDESLVDEIPSQAVVHRTYAFDSGRHLAIRGRHMAMLSVPDPYLTWLPFGVARGLRVIRGGRIDALYSTSPPATAHLIAATLHRMTKVPWVADFRDPWIEEGTHPRPGSFRYRVESALERWVVRGATRLVMTTSNLRGDFLRRYPALPAERVQVIYNGYDEDDFEDFAPQVSREEFEIIHPGLVTREFRDPRPLLQTLADLIRDGLLSASTVRVTFLGGGPWLRSADFPESVARMGLREVVRVERQMPHRQAIKRLARAGVLLVLQASDDTRSLIPAKTFEYLRTGLPILALTHDGATADLLKGMEQCHVVHPSDHLALRRAVLTLYEMWRDAPAALARQRAIQQFERRALTGELVRVLHETCAESRGGGEGSRC